MGEPNAMYALLSMACQLFEDFNSCCTGSTESPPPRNQRGHSVRFQVPEASKVLDEGAVTESVTVSATSISLQSGDPEGNYPGLSCPGQQVDGWSHSGPFRVSNTPMVEIPPKEGNRVNSVVSGGSSYPCTCPDIPMICFPEEVAGYEGDCLHCCASPRGMDLLPLDYLPNGMSHLKFTGVPDFACSEGRLVPGSQPCGHDQGAVDTLCVSWQGGGNGVPSQMRPSLGHLEMSPAWSPRLRPRYSLEVGAGLLPRVTEPSESNVRRDSC